MSKLVLVVRVARHKRTVSTERRLQKNDAFPEAENTALLSRFFRWLTGPAQPVLSSLAAHPAHTPITGQLQCPQLLVPCRPSPVALCNLENEEVPFPAALLPRLQATHHRPEDDAAPSSVCCGVRMRFGFICGAPGTLRIPAHLSAAPWLSERADPRSESSLRRGCKGAHLTALETPGEFKHSCLSLCPKDADVLGLMWSGL